MPDDICHHVLGHSSVLQDRDDGLADAVEDVNRTEPNRQLEATEALSDGVGPISVLVDRKPGRTRVTLNCRNAPVVLQRWARQLLSNSDRDRPAAI